MSLLSIISGLGGGYISAPTGGGGETPPPPTDYHTPLVAATIDDDGYYNGFPFPQQLSDGTLISIYKKSGSHAAKGPMTIAKSTDGGASWVKSQINVAGTAIQCAAISMGVLPTGRILIAYQDDELYTSLKFAYSDNKGTTWTSAGMLSFGAGYSSSPAPVKMLVMPSGKIRMGYYKFGTGSNPAIIGFINSTDNGLSWSFGETIFSHGGTGFGDNKGHEFSFVITHNTGVDATCKMIAVVRDADVGAVYMHYKSSDGGATWTTDTVTVDNPGGYNRHYIYKFGSATSQAPSDLVLYNGLVYMITGYRNTGGAGADYYLTYMTATPDDAFNNVYAGWSAPVRVMTFNATTLGSDIDCGYPLFFVDYAGKLWCHYYDVSTQPSNPAITADRCLIKQLLINSNT